VVPAICELYDAQEHLHHPLKGHELHEVSSNNWIGYISSPQYYMKDAIEKGFRKIHKIELIDILIDTFGKV